MNKKQLKEKIYKYYTIFEKFYENNKNVFESKNLKCYDANYYLYTKAVQDYPLLDDDDRARVWEDFCDCEFDSFRMEHDLDCFKYIGRTSTFYLIPKKLQEDSFDVSDLKDPCVFAVALMYFNRAEWCFGYTLEEQKNDIEQMSQKELADFLENLQDFDIAKTFEECVNISNYLDDFKKNQVDIIKNYLEGANDLALEAELERQNAEAHQKELKAVVKEALRVYRMHINEQDFKDQAQYTKTLSLISEILKEAE